MVMEMRVWPNGGETMRLTVSKERAAPYHPCPLGDETYSSSEIFQ